MHPSIGGSNVYTSQLIVCLKMVARHYLEAPHVVEMSPAVVACSPRDAGAKVVMSTKSPADHHSSPRQKGEAWQSPWLRQVRDGAGVGGWEQFNAREGHDSIIQTAYHNLP